MENLEKTYVVDTSVVIEKAISRMIKKNEIKGKILIPRAVLAELEHQANQRQETGMLGLEELQSLQESKKKGLIELEYVGTRPNPVQIKYAKSGEIDAMIKDIAYENDAVLITADRVQAESSKALGVKVKFLELKLPKTQLEIEKFFDDTTMSVHLKENTYPVAKKGKPGEWGLVRVGDKKLDSLEVQEIAKEVVEYSRIDPESFIEISRSGSTIVQYRNYRVVIVKPPVSDGWEITVVKPLKQFKLEDYKLPDKILERVKKKARGIIVAGETGSGKSTFASALAEFYAGNGRITKTVESPRDLVLGDEITQYSKNFTTSEEIHDILFLSRPDNIIFDEVRDTPDFKLYVDLRLGGSNCLGVLHSASPIDAIQRFIGRLDTGMIPSVLDTLIYIEKGTISKILTLRMVVKVPEGMTEADLGRPVIVVSDFNSGKAEYEIYSYGEETVVIPISGEETNPLKSLAAKEVARELKKICSDVSVDLVSNNKAVIKVPSMEIARVIGKQGSNIEAIEKKLGLSIDVQELGKSSVSEGKEDVRFTVNEKKNFLGFFVDDNLNGKQASFYIGGDFVFSATVGKKGEIKVHTKSNVGRSLMNAMNLNQEVSIRV